MKLTPIVLVIASLFFGALAISAAQVLEKIPDTNFTRETELDEAGLQQFKAYEQKCEACRGRGTWDCRGCAGQDWPHCAECGGTKKARCRDCAGTGKLLDSLVELPCPYCKGSGRYACGLCGGGAAILEKRSSGEETRKPCGACKKVGTYPCVVCDQKGKIPSIRIKKKPPMNAKLKDLLATREKLAAVLTELEAFDPGSKASKNTKALEAMLKKPGRLLPPLSDMLDLLETVQKGLVKAGSTYANFEERQTHQFRVFRDRSIYLVRHSIRVLDLCIARAEFNQNVSKSK